MNRRALVWATLSVTIYILVAAGCGTREDPAPGARVAAPTAYFVTTEAATIAGLGACPDLGAVGLVTSAADGGITYALFHCKKGSDGGLTWAAIGCDGDDSGSLAYVPGTPNTLYVCADMKWSAVPLPAGEAGPPGPQGPQGDAGAPGVSPQVTETALDAGDSNCPNGGLQIVVSTPASDGGAGTTQTAYACNGANGAAGTAAVCPAPASLCVVPDAGALYCANLGADTNNCGGCGVVCPPVLVCNAGVCGCPSGQTSCGGACTSVQTDSNNCGACGTTCALPLVCSGGACGCPSGLTACGGGCTSVQTDSNNCGACGAACASGQVCNGQGACIASMCGNGVIDPGEQCDDGNLFNLDGCDSTCHYEVVTRATSFSIAGGATPATLGCTPGTNLLGTRVLTGAAAGQLNNQISSSIGGGTTNVMAQFLGLADTTGVSAAGFTIGFLDATPDPTRGGWPGGSPIDWSFDADHLLVDATGRPLYQFGNAVLSNGNLTAGPSTIAFELPLGGAQDSLTLLDAHVAATIDNGVQPNVPTPTVAQLASGLTVFQTVTGSGAGQGICGNVTVASLAAIPVPAALTGVGSFACGSCGGSRVYTACGTSQTPLNSACNSLLDVIVGGCKVLSCQTPAVNPTQPDVPAGAAVTPLVLDSNNKVSSATTTNDNDAYSAYFAFAANRAHFTAETCAVTSDCQSGKACNSGLCL